MSARRLVIDCATPAMSIALFEGDRLLASHHSELGRGHAEALLPAIAALPEGGKAGEILVDIGPGSFTGVRVGIAAACALGFAWGATVSGYGCLDLVAAVVRRDYAPSGDFAVVMIGGHGELFWARFPAGAQPQPARIQSTPIASLATMLDDAVIYGTGAQLLIDARQKGGESVTILPDASRVGLLAQALATLPPKPNYGRGADAKPMAHAGPDLPQGPA